MKKGIKTRNKIKSRKWRVTWAVLILIFPLILVSVAGSENGIDNYGSTTGINLEQKIRSDDTNKLFEPQDNTSTDSTGNQGSTEEELEKQEDGNNTDSTNNTENTDNQENTEEKNEKVDGDSNNTDSNNTDNQKDTEEKNQINKDSNNTDSNNTDNQKDTEEKNQINKDSNSTDSNNTDNQKDTEEKNQINKDSNSTDNTDNKKNAEEKNEQVDENNNDTDSTDNEKSTEEIEQKQEVIQGNESIKSSESNPKLKEKVNNSNYSSGSIGSKTEQKSLVCKGTKSLEIGKTKNETRIRACNKTYSPGTVNATPEIIPELGSWNILEIMLEYPYSIQSYYTTQEKVEVSYNGPETLRGQKVDVYLFKDQSLNFSGTAVDDSIDKNTNENILSFEDFINTSTEPYIHLSSTLDAGGDLSSLYLGPLPAGSYCLFVTLAGNNTNTCKPKEVILLENNFEVLEYEVEVQAPGILEEGENIEVNLALKNAPSQGNYTYWAVLIKEDAFRENRNGSSGEMRAGTESFLKGLKMILGINSTFYESKLGKEELKGKIQSLIGEGNGTISIGEENQGTLSLTTFDLLPGDYLLFAGAYEENKGLSGIVQNDLTIFQATTEDSGSKSHSNEHGSNGFPKIKSKAPATLETKESIFNTTNLFGLEDLQSQIRGKPLVEIIRNPPKMPSFLLGLTGTLFVGLLFRKMKNKIK